MTTARNLRAGLILPAFIVLFGATGLAFAADKPFGVIDTMEIFEKYEGAQDATRQWENFQDDVNREIEDRTRAFQRLQEEFESQKMLLGPSARDAKAQELDQAKAEFLQFQRQIEVRVQQEYREISEPIINQIKILAENIGRDEGFGIIIDSSAMAVLYLDPDVDLTGKVLTALVSGDQEVNRD